VTCALCDPRFIPDQPTISAADPRAYYYLHGFIQGVMCARGGGVPTLCPAHQRMLEQAFEATRIGYERDALEAAKHAAWRYRADGHTGDH
jgi:hypothetical protein